METAIWGRVALSPKHVFNPRPGSLTNSRFFRLIFLFNDGIGLSYCGFDCIGMEIDVLGLVI
uniref:Uncharacterized protein n=1 Tax=Kalanchoe fedtschenkoi TaxID=63787 RepID=A0A7N0ZS30_KALFE